MRGSFLWRAIWALAAAGVGFLPVAGAVSAQGRECAVPERFYAFEPPLPKTVAALAGGQAVSIVAVGGASTLGRAAGGSEFAWPARLAAALAGRFPAARVAVINRGIARQTSKEMAARFEREVLAPKPTLVIWETGTMEAVREADLDDFRETLQEGIGRLRAAGSEVMLMNMQFSRLTHAVTDFARYLLVLREVADANDVPLFRRHGIMRHWAESGILDLRIADRENRRELAVRLYDCIGRAVADFVTRGVPAARPGRATGPRSGR